MRYKYFFVAALVLFLSGFSFVNASILSDSFIKLVNIKSMSVNSNLNHSFKNGLFGSSTNEKGSVVLNINSSQDINKPENVRSNQVFTGEIKTKEFNSSLKTSLVLIGDTIYFQIPIIKPDGIFPEEVSKEINKYSGQWIKISPQDINSLESQYPGIKEIYDRSLEFNKEPNLLLSRVSVLIKKYSSIFNIKKSGSRTADGIKQDKYILTLNTTKLTNLLIAESNKFFKYETSKERLERQKEIKQNLSTFKIRNAFVFIGQKDNLPYQMSFTIDLLDDNRKVESTTKFDMNFSDFGRDFTSVIVPPTEYITFTDFYNNVIKPLQDKAKKDAEKAILKASLVNYRVWNTIVYDEMSSKYGTAINNGSCTNPTLGSIFNKPLGDDLENSDYCNECSADLIKILIDSSGSEKRCYSTVDAYAIQLSYKDNSGYFCIDSTGQSKETTNLITGPVCGN